MIVFMISRDESSTGDELRRLYMAETTGPRKGERSWTLSNQICAGSSGSGSRTGTSGFSGGLGGSLMGAGEGSEGVRRWWRVVSPSHVRLPAPPSTVITTFRGTRVLRRDS